MYKELAVPAQVHAVDVFNDLPEAGDKTPLEKMGRVKRVLGEVEHVFGSEVRFYEDPKRRLGGKTDATTKRGIYLGRCRTMPGGVKIAEVYYNEQRQMWSIGETISRVYVQINDGVFPLTERPGKITTAKDMEKELGKFDSKQAVQEVYVLDKIHKHRKIGRSTQYECSWKGYAKNDRTWEPEKHLTEYGGAQMLKEYKHSLIPKGAVRHVKTDRVVITAVELVTKYKISEQYNTAAVVEAIQKEEKNVIGEGRPLQELYGAERQAVLRDSSLDKVRIRLNPEEKDPNADHPEGRLKMRLIAMGNMMRDEHRSKDPIDAPVVMLSTLRTLIAGGCDSKVKSVEDDEIVVGDIEGAFNEARMYPDGVRKYAIWQMHRGGPLRVFRRMKGLYGTDDAPMEFHKTFVDWIKTVGYVNGENDKSLFVHPVTKHRVVKHVDDMLMRGGKKQNKKFMQECDKATGGKFPIKGWHTVTDTSSVEYCGKEILRKTVDGQVYYGITQRKEIREFLDAHGFIGVKTVVCPMMDRKELNSDSRGVTEEEHAWLRSVIGSLSYYAEHSVWDMCAEVNMISQHMSKPTQGTIKATRRVLAWLSGEGVWDRVWWVPRVCTNRWDIFVDSDWAGDKASGNNRSRTGVVILLNGLPVFWRSNKQPETAISSAQAEIYALSEAVRDTRLRYWVAEEMLMDVVWPADIQVDNAAGVTFQNKMSPSSKLKGVFDLRNDWVKELQDKNQIRAVKVNTKNNLADILTKPLNGAERSRLEEKMLKIGAMIVAAEMKGKGLHLS